MRIGTLSSASTALIESPSDPNGWWLWNYRSIAEDINGDGKTEVVLVSNTMLEGYSLQIPNVNPRTYITVLSLDNGVAKDVTSTYVADQYVEGWSRRTYLEDLNNDGIKDFIFVMNQEDGRDNSNMGKGATSSFWMGSYNKILLSEGNKFVEKTFGESAWHHLGAVGDYNSNGLFDFLDGYFMDKDGYGSILLWEFDPAQQNFVLKSDASDIGISASSGLIFDNFLIASKEYPNNGSILIIDLETGKKKEIFSHIGTLSNEKLVFWNGNVDDTLVKTLPDGSKISENGSGEIKTLANTENTKIVVLTEDISDLVTNDGGKTWLNVSRQDLHLIDVQNQSVIQTIDHYTRLDSNYQNTFNVVDINNDGFNDIAYDKSVLWNLNNKFVFKSDYEFWSLLDDKDMVNIYTGHDFGDNFDIFSIDRVSDNLIFTSLTRTVYLQPDGSSSPNSAISAFGLDKINNGYGIVNSVKSDFSLLNVISHEATKNNIFSDRMLDLGDKMLLVAKDQKTYSLSPNPDGTLAFSYYRNLSSGTLEDNQFQYKSGTLFDGREGVDSLRLETRFADSHILKTGSAILVGSYDDSGSCEGVNLERLQFSDVTLALDTAKGEIAGEAYRIYKAAFDRAPDAGGLGFWISALDKGASITGVAAGFINSPEFQKLYGANVSDRDYVTKLYNNVLDRNPDQGGYDFWLGALANGATREDILVNFSESKENIANVADLIANGIQYQEWVG